MRKKVTSGLACAYYIRTHVRTRINPRLLRKSSCYLYQKYCLVILAIALLPYNYNTYFCHVLQLLLECMLRNQSILNWECHVPCNYWIRQSINWFLTVGKWNLINQLFFLALGRIPELKYPSNYRHPYRVARFGQYWTRHGKLFDVTMQDKNTR